MVVHRQLEHPVGDVLALDEQILGEEGGLQLVLEAILTGFFFAYCKLFGNLNQRVN